MTQGRRFIVVQTEMDAERHLAHDIAELKVDRRGVDRIAADDDQSIDPALVHVVGEILKRLKLIDRLGFNRVGVYDCPAGVAERRVHRMRQRVD